MTTYVRRRATDHIVVHCSATRPSQDISARDIDRWHRAQGWSGIGYHFVIRRDGTLEHGRPADVIGSHVQGHNAKSIGICLAGGVAEDGKTPEDNFTAAQKATLEATVKELLTEYPKATVQGHRDFPGVKKACPSFDVRKWWASL